MLWKYVAYFYVITLVLTFILSVLTLMVVFTFFSFTNLMCFFALQWCIPEMKKYGRLSLVKYDTAMAGGRR